MYTSILFTLGRGVLVYIYMRDILYSPVNRRSLASTKWYIDTYIYTERGALDLRFLLFMVAAATIYNISM